MANILIEVFDTEQEAKEQFAVICESSTLKGCYFAQSGKLYLTGTVAPLVSENKFYVLSSSAAVFCDPPSDDG